MYIYLYSLFCFTHTCRCFLRVCETTRKTAEALLALQPCGKETARFILAHLFRFLIVRIGSLLTKAKTTSSEHVVLWDV